MTTNPPPNAPPPDVQTLPALLAWRARATPQAEAYREYDGAQDTWVSLTWTQAAERIARWTRAMAGFALPHGTRVGVLMPNGVNAVCADLAVLAVAGVPVPMHVTDNPGSLAYILADSEAQALVVASIDQWRHIASAGLALPALRHVVIVDGEPGPDDAPPDTALYRLQDWLARADAQDGSSSRAQPVSTDLAGLVYTSGTTGKPKGVMLTHANVVANVRATMAVVVPRVDDVFLSFLPLSHTLERTAGYYVPMAAGSCVAFARSTALLVQDFGIVRPTVLISVPRIYERVHAGLQAMLVDHPFKARLFGLAQAVGWRRFCRRQRLPVQTTSPAWLDELAWPLLDALVARPLLARFGGRLRAAISGGAPLASSIARTFLGLGLPILQGYGMTETSPVVAVNALDDNDPATVGAPLPGVQVRIGEGRELLVQAPSVMRGYWKRDEDTARAFVDGGWLRTGDQAEIDARGHVRILGRIKEIIVTSTGEKIAPVDLELAITTDPLFEQVLVLGDDRPFIACILVLNAAAWQDLARGLSLDPAQSASLQADSARQAVLVRVKALTKGFPYYAQPRAVALTLDAWTVENGLMTPTLKAKRKPLIARYADQIEALYRRP